MKRKLFALPFVLILLIALAACSGEKDSSKQAGTSKSGTPKDGGTLTIGVSDNPDTMNPLYANDRVSLTVQQALYAPLYHMEDGKKSLFLLRALRLQKIN